MSVQASSIATYYSSPINGDIMAAPPASPAEPSPPSDKERIFYYHGLPCRPRIVARTGKDEFTGPHGELDTSHVKYVEPVGRHPIVDLWNSGKLARDISDLLAEEKIDWTAIDLIRLSKKVQGEKVAPITILITIQPESCCWLNAYLVSMSCQERISQDVPGVEVELKEYPVDDWTPYPREPLSPAPQGSLRLWRHLDEDRYLAPLSEYLGTGIAGLSDPYRQGTKGAYLRERGTGRVFALTSWHAVLSHLPLDCEYRYTGGTLRESVIQLGNDEFIHFTYMIPILPSRFRSSVLGLGDPSSRIIGHVVFSPRVSLDYERDGMPYDPSRPRFGHLRDWALIELHQTSHTTRLRQLANRVYTTKNFALQINSAIRRQTMSASTIYNPQDADKSPVFRMDDNRKGEDSYSFRLQGTMPEADKGAPPPDEPRVVAKQGTGTEFTVSMVNKAVSLIRQPVAGSFRESIAWCIVPHPESMGDARIFSQRGDSGACIFDPRGRIGGIITAGDDQDMTYACPMDWLLEDIRSFGFDVELM